jgi:hypothetical protein
MTIITSKYLLAAQKLAAHANKLQYKSYFCTIKISNSQEAEGSGADKCPCHQLWAAGKVYQDE